MRTETAIAQKGNTSSWIINKLTRSTTIFIAMFIILFGAFLTAVSSNFLSSYNIGIILRQMSFFGVAALGQTLVLIIGGIDLSVGSTAGLGGIMFAYFMVRMGMNPIIAIFLALAIGALIGYINGLIITKFKLGPFIVTLAISGICYGLILVITKGSTISGITGPCVVPWSRNAEHCSCSYCDICLNCVGINLCA